MSCIILNDLHNLILTTIHEAGTCICPTLQMIRLSSLPEVALLGSCREQIQYMHSHSRTCVLKLYLLWISHSLSIYTLMHISSTISYLKSLLTRCVEPHSHSTHMVILSWREYKKRPWEFWLNVFLWSLSFFGLAKMMSYISITFLIFRGNFSTCSFILFSKQPCEQCKDDTIILKMKLTNRELMGF